MTRKHLLPVATRGTGHSSGSDGLLGHIGSLVDTLSAAFTEAAARLTRFWDIVSGVIRARRTSRALCRLDEHMLKDIGVCRSEIEAISRLVATRLDPVHPRSFG